MGIKKFQRIGITIFVILLLINPGSSLDQGTVKPGFNETSLSYNISIKLWGYDDVSSNLSEELLKFLPSSMITESEYPAEDKIDQYFLSANRAIFGINNKISYTIEPINMVNEIEYLTSRITYFDNSDIKGGITQTYYDNDILKNQTGFVIDSQNFGTILSNFNNPTGYTLHLLNLTQLDNFGNNSQSKHWYRSGELLNIPEQSDIRNVGIVGSNGLFYDPSASSPVFDTDYLKTLSFNQVVSTLASRITNLIENVFIGTPYAFSYNFLEERAHFDLVIIGSNTTTKYESGYSTVRNKISGVNFTDLSAALNELLPYFEIETENIEILLQENPKIDEIINKFEQQRSDDTSNYIKITKNVAEEFKNGIRRYKHTEWPTGFYYSLIVFVDSDNRQFIWDVNGLEQEYVYGEVGLGILNLADWINLPDKDILSLKQQVLQGFGNMIGIPRLSNNFSNQVESVMSTYGITDEWNYRYNQFEIDSMTRRVGTLYYNSAIHQLKSFRVELKEGTFRWLDRSSLDDAELLLRQGQIEYARGNYTGATKLYMQGYFDWLKAKEDLIQKQNAVYNGIQLTAVVIIMLYLISTLKLFTITKDELYEKFDIDV